MAEEEELGMTQVGVAMNGRGFGSLRRRLAAAMAGQWENHVWRGLGYRAGWARRAESVMGEIGWVMGRVRHRSMEFPAKRERERGKGTREASTSAAAVETVEKQPVMRMAAVHWILTRGAMREEVREGVNQTPQA